MAKDIPDIMELSNDFVDDLSFHIYLLPKYNNNNNNTCITIIIITLLFMLPQDGYMILFD